MSRLGEGKRLMSPSSASRVTEASLSIPRRATSDFTTGARDHCSMANSIPGLGVVHRLDSLSLHSLYIPGEPPARPRGEPKRIKPVVEVLRPAGFIPGPVVTVTKKIAVYSLTSPEELIPAVLIYSAPVSAWLPAPRREPMPGRNSRCEAGLQASVRPFCRSLFSLPVLWV